MFPIGVLVIKLGLTRRRGNCGTSQRTDVRNYLRDILTKAGGPPFISNDEFDLGCPVLCAFCKGRALAPLRLPVSASLRS